MSRLKLVSYIKQNLKDGFRRREIRNALFNAGWNKNDVEMAFQSVNGPRRRLFGLLAVLIITPLVGFGSAWLYSKYETGAPLPERPSAETETVAGLTQESQKERQDRDQKRISDIVLLQTALDQYFTAHQRYPGNLSELVTAGLLPDLPKDPKTAEPYLYNPLGDPPLYYSISFILEEEAGSFRAGFNNVGSETRISKDKS